MTHQKSIIAALFFFPFITIAQEKTAINKIGVNYSFDHTFNNKTAIIGFHSGVNYVHQFKNGLIMEGGLQYARFGYDGTSVVWVPPNTLADPALPIGLGKDCLDYLGAPIKIGYGWQIGKRISLSASSGISTNIFLARRVKQENNSEEKTSTSYTREPFGAQYDRMNFVSVTSIGIDFRLCGAFSIRVEPTFRYFINSIMDDSAHERPYSTGLNMTLFYKLGNKSKSTVSTAP